MKYRAEFELVNNKLIIYAREEVIVTELDKMSKSRLKKFLEDMIPSISMHFIDWNFLFMYCYDRGIYLERI